MPFEWTRNYGAPGFNPEDYDYYRSQGYSDADMRQFFQSNRSYFGEGRINVGGKVRQILGLGNEYGNEFNSRSQGERDQLAIGAYTEYLSQLNANRRNQDSGSSGSDTSRYDSEISGLKRSLEDYQRSFNDSRASYERMLEESDKRFNESKSSFEKQLQERDMRFNESKSSFEKQLQERDNLLAQRGTELTQAQEKAEAARGDAERFRQINVDSQLQALRDGSSRGASIAGPIARDLATGRSATAANAGGSVVRLVDRNESVLSRKGPVVEVINRGGASGSSGRSLSSGGSAAAAGGSAAGYYSRRFG